MRTKEEIIEYFRKTGQPRSWFREFLYRLENPSNQETNPNGLGIELERWIDIHTQLGSLKTLISNVVGLHEIYRIDSESRMWRLLDARYKGWLEEKPDTAKWLYRLEYKDSTNGLWYDGSGYPCWSEGIGSLGDSCKTKFLPMDYDPRYKEAGRNWFSSCSRKEDLLHWYSKEDATELIKRGFVFTRYLALEYKEYPLETVFIKETCIEREVIDFNDLWKE